MNYLPLLLSMVAALLWVWVVAPLALLLVGLPLRVSWRERQNALRELGFLQYLFLHGVLTAGMAGFVFFMANALLEWRFSEAWAIGFIPAPFNSGWRMLFILSIWGLFRLVLRVGGLEEAIKHFCPGITGGISTSLTLSRVAG